jgi:hypothetical protein
VGLGLMRMVSLVDLTIVSVLFLFARKRLAALHAHLNAMGNMLTAAPLLVKPNMPRAPCLIFAFCHFALHARGRVSRAGGESVHATRRVVFEQRSAWSNARRASGALAPTVTASRCCV